MNQRIGASLLILFTLAALILVLLSAGYIAIGSVSFDFYIAAFPPTLQIISLLIIFCIGCYWFMRTLPHKK
jgi:ABC-type nickel/cobalt efflux system permease component RcnA